MTIITISAQPVSNNLAISPSNEGNGIRGDVGDVGISSDISISGNSISELKEKLLALLIQLPPSIDIVEGLDALRNILPYLDKGYRYAVQVRHRSWFQDLAYSFFANNNLCLVWSQLADIRTLPIVTSDFVYVRLIGDRSIQEKDFGLIQIDRIKEMKKSCAQLHE
jgi:uncharacterized protein YecE (DUF72 family)